MFLFLIACTEPFANCGEGTVEKDGECVASDDSSDADTDTDSDSDTDSDADSDADADADADADSDADADTDADTDTDTLPDARDGMVRNADDCQVIDGHEDVRAGRVWYWGEFAGNSKDGWAGVESWFFFPNDNWKAAGVDDCVITWDLSAVSDSIGACSDCNYGMRIASASINGTDTTCPVEAYTGDNDYDPTTETYALEFPGDGTSIWHFPGSGKEFATGYADGGDVNYLADGGCDVATF